MKNILTFKLFEASQSEIEAINKQDSKPLPVENLDSGYIDLKNNLKSFLIGKTITFYPTKGDMESKTNPMTMEIKEINFICESPSDPNPSFRNSEGNRLVLFSHDSNSSKLGMLSPKRLQNDMKNKYRSFKTYVNPEIQMDYFGKAYIKTEDNPNGAPFGVVYSPNLYKALQSNESTKGWIDYVIPAKKSESSDF